MKRTGEQKGVLYLLMTVLSAMQLLYAQMAEKVYMTDHHIEAQRKGQFSVDIDNLVFFRNNEYNSTAQKGYTLPGFRLQMKTVYYPLSTIKLEAGVHSIWFWGATKYPAFSYREIAMWQGFENARNMHLLPFLRAHLDLSDRLSFVLGDIYGGANHRLIEPLYNPELNLTSDPETGLQLLYNTERFHLDFWIDWMTFIYRLDTRQESFVAGSSAFLSLNDPTSRLHVYIPFQGITQHKGGEIELIDENIQTLMNGALGAGLEWNANGRILKSVKTEYALAGYYFPKGRTYEPESGKGRYAKAAVQLKDFNISASYWSCNRFIPVFGSVFYSSVSKKIPGMIYKKPAMGYLGVDYVRSLGKGYALGFKAEVYRYLSGKMYASETGEYQPINFGKNALYSIEVSFRMTPSFLIKKF